MHHDKILKSANPDYVLMENEADQIAHSAAKALKASQARYQLHSQSLGIEQPNVSRASVSRYETKYV
jgi:hypothetical protein